MKRQSLNRTALTVVATFWLSARSQLLSCESHALTHMCRARTVGDSEHYGAAQFYTRAHTWSRDLRMCCGGWPPSTAIS